MKESTTNKEQQEQQEQQCYLRISIAGSPSKTIVFNLHTQSCPKTCTNFLSFCTSPPSSSKTYHNSIFHRIIPGFMVQGGDYQNSDGTGGEPFEEGIPYLPDESFEHGHDRAGVLSMANRGRNTAASQFFITLGKASHLDGKHVVFGYVVEGMDVLREIEGVETDERDRPVNLQKVIITDCGIGDGRNKAVSSGGSSQCSTNRNRISGSDSVSDDSSRRNRSHSKKKKKKKSSHDRSSSSKGRRDRKKRSSRSKYDSSSDSDSDLDDESSVSSRKRKRKHKKSSSSRRKHRKQNKSKSSSRSRKRKYSSSDSSSSSSSSSEDEDDDGSSYSSDSSRRRRHRRKKKRSSSKKEKKSRKAKGKNAKDKKNCSTATTSNTTSSTIPTFGQYGIIKESQLRHSSKTKRSFEQWLAEIKNIPQGTNTNVPKYEMTNFIKEYVEDYNTATLPHIKYYDYDDWEMKEYERAKEEAKSKVGNVRSDEFDHLEEVRRKTVEKQRKDLEIARSLMSREKVEEMKGQARLKAEMVNAYRVGDDKTRKKLQRRLEPDEK